ncbi:SecE subunit of protein translocation complex [Candidatus Magnetomorum sp. HK-1]|nr:SecE subunit of protein translocation complex [Candidatus Magnetomorum sp. HK-1]
MGRLQRKKTIKKKKKKNIADDQLSQPSLESKEVKKSFSQIAYKSSVRDQGAVARRFSQPRIPKPKFIDDSVQFLREVKIELKKVAWPSRKQTISSTSVVIVLVLIFSIFFGIVDAGLSGLVRYIY